MKDLKKKREADQTALGSVLLYFFPNISVR